MNRTQWQHVFDVFFFLHGFCGIAFRLVIAIAIFNGNNNRSKNQRTGAQEPAWMVAFSIICAFVGDTRSQASLKQKKELGTKCAHFLRTVVFVLDAYTTINYNTFNLNLNTLMAFDFFSSMFSFDWFRAYVWIRICVMSFDITRSFASHMNQIDGTSAWNVSRDAFRRCDW